MANLGCQNSETPEPIDIKFDMGDYVGDVTPHANNQSDRPTGDFPANKWIVTLEWILMFCDPHILRISLDQAAEPIFTLFDS